MPGFRGVVIIWLVVVGVLISFILWGDIFVGGLNNHSLNGKEDY